MRAGLLASALTVMALQGSARADAAKESAPLPTTDAAPSAPAPETSSSPGAQAEAAPAQAAPARPTPPIPPPPAYPLAPQCPPPGDGYPYGGPPPGYAYPPPGYGPYPYYVPPPGHPYRHPRYRVYEPDDEREPGSSGRPYVLTFGIGLAALSGSSGVLGDEPAHRMTEMGLSYTLRLAFAANDRWSVVLGLEGTRADFSSGFYRADDDYFHGSATFSSTIFTVGPQFFIKPWLSARLGVGLGCLSWDDGDLDELTCRGMAATGGLDYEFYQTSNISTAVELAASAAWYTPESGSGDWYSLGLNLVLNVF